MYSIKPALTLVLRDMSFLCLEWGKDASHNIQARGPDEANMPVAGHPGTDGAHGETTRRPPFANVSLTQTFARVSMSFSCVGITITTLILP